MNDTVFVVISDIISEDEFSSPVLACEKVFLTWEDAEKWAEAAEKFDNYYTVIPLKVVK